MHRPLQTIAPSIDDPIELLLACHDKVRRFAGLAVRLRDHLPLAGADRPAQEAAQSILRYFEMAAPLHHEDEERDLFPALRALGQAKLSANMDSLQAEHADLGLLWRPMHVWLQAIASGRLCPSPIEVDAFAQRYTAHAQREEDQVYPAASQLSSDALKRISAAMVLRRTHR